MQLVGQKLRATRRAIGVSLDRVSANTRIPTKILQAIEEDDLAAFHSAFLYRSFVRQFAEQLKLNVQDLAPDIQEAANRIAEPPMPGQNSHQPKIPALNLGHPVKVRWVYSLGSLVLVVMICSGLHALWQNSESKVRPSPEAGIPDSIAQSASVQSEPNDATGPVATAAANPNPGFQIELSAVERTWLSIMDDGRHVFSGILGASQTKVLVAYRTARIRTGNAGGVNVIFNGRTLGPLGARGQVATVVFTPKGYKIFETSARMTPVEFIPSGE